SPPGCGSWSYRRSLRALPGRVRSQAMNRGAVMKRCDLCGAACAEPVEQCSCGSRAFTPGAAVSEGAVLSGQATPARQAHFPVWYSSENHFRRWVKLSLNSDRGTLTAAPGRLEFWGRKLNLDLRGLGRISLTGLYWPTLIGLAWGLGLVLIAAGAGVFSILS